MQVTVKRSSGAAAMIESEAWKRIVHAAVLLESEMKQAISVSNPRPHKTPSAPDEPPRLRSGFLLANVTTEYDRAALAARVGVRKNAYYGLFLDRGTSRMRARPWIGATAKRISARLAATLGESA